MEKSKNHRKVILKQSEILGAIRTGIEEIGFNKTIRITPFAHSLTVKGETPHKDTIQSKLTDGKFWQEIFSQYNIEFEIDEFDFVNCFRKVEKKEELKDIKKSLDSIERKLNILLDSLKSEKKENDK